MQKSNKVQVLFICTGNSARSQMAEGLLRKKAGDIVDVYSGGSKPASEVHPLAKRMLIENGIDPSGQYPKKLSEYFGKEFDIIVTTCDKARQSCPIFPGNAQNYHWSLDDPAAVEGSEQDKLAVFQKIFAEISERVSSLISSIRDIYNRKNQ